MPKSVTVNFEDGTSHTYDNVPDDVTQEQVDARAKSEYKDKTITNVSDGGPKDESAESELNLGQKAVGALATAGSLAIAHPEIPAGAAALYKANKLANTWMASKNAEMAAQKEVARIRAEAAAGHQNIQQQKINAKMAPVAPQIEVPVNAGGGARTAPTAPTAPIAEPVAKPGAPTIAQMFPNSTINTAAPQISQAGRFGALAERYGPMLKSAMTPQNIVRGVGSALTAPESLLSLPYAAAAYEQGKIRENPNAPEYANNPYAQQYRGEAPTQGAAGAMNQRRAVVGQQYGGLSAEDQARLEDDQAKRMIRYAALKKALGQ